MGVIGREHVIRAYLLSRSTILTSTFGSRESRFGKVRWHGNSFSTGIISIQNKSGKK